MQSFQTHQGLNSFINRLELEVEHCRKQQPFQIQVGPVRRDSLADALEHQQAEEEAAQVMQQEAEVSDLFLSCLELFKDFLLSLIGIP